MFQQGYDEGFCRICGEYASGEAYDVAGICEKCAENWDWDWDALNPSHILKSIVNEAT